MFTFQARDLYKGFGSVFIINERVCKISAQYLQKICLCSPNRTRAYRWNTITFFVAVSVLKVIKIDF